MPELGRYAAEVLAAYGVSIVLVAALVGWSFIRAAKVRRALDEVESRSKSDGR